MATTTTLAWFVRAMLLVLPFGALAAETTAVTAAAGVRGYRGSRPGTLMQRLWARACSSAQRRQGMLVGAIAAMLLGVAMQGHAAGAPDPVSAVAREVAALRVEIVATETEAEHASAELAHLRAERDALDASMRRIERRAEVPALGREFVQAVSEQLHLLPATDQVSAAHGRREHALEAASDGNLRTERALAELGDVAAVASKRAASAQPSVPAPQQMELAAAVAEQLTQQVELLKRLDALQRGLLVTLQQSNAAEHDLQQRGHAAGEALTRLLFWVPARPGMHVVEEFPPAMAWTLSADNWRAVAAALRDGAGRQPLWPALAVAIAIALLAGRRRLCDRLGALSPARMGFERYRLGATVAAFAITCALALPGPLLLWTAANLLRGAPEAAPFPHAVGDALAAIARLLWAMSAFAWLLDRRGVGCTHFGWDEASHGLAARALRRFTVPFVALMFVAVLNGLDRAPFPNRESLGRLAFLLAMVALAGFFVRLLRRSSPLMRAVGARNPRSGLVRWHAAWFTLLLALPLGVATLAAAGYFVAAGYFFARMLLSLFIALGAVMLYGLMALWVHVQPGNLLRRRDDHDEAAPPLSVASGSDVLPAPAPRVDVGALGEQTRSLLDLSVTSLLLVGMWMVWKDAVPTLSVIGDYALWSYDATVGGKTVALPLTVGRLFVTILIGAITAVAVRNVGALLDFVLLQRLEVQPDANYAIKVVARYALVAVGVVLSCNNLGIAWSDVHWLVAALGVGLGFGLQEIVANFVSGLIVLGERPIRMGDVVTVGEVTGTVSRIRARATAVLDFDNKEVIIPNKAFITDRIVNWTLSNQTTRVLLQIGVAYGSDIALVQRLLFEAVDGEADVLREPVPTVYFVGFGDSALNFEIRVFVDSIAKRLPVKHAINVAIDRVLGKNGIEIPFPQRDLHIRSAPGLDSLHPIDHRGTSTTNPVPPDSDATED